MVSSKTRRTSKQRAQTCTRKLVFVVCTAGWIGCSVDPTANPAYGEPCPSGSKMYRNFCIDAGQPDRGQSDAAITGRSDAAIARNDGAVGEDAVPDAPKPTASSDDASAPSPPDITGQMCTTDTAMYCYLGPAGTDNQGVCHGGSRSCTDGSWEECVGQVLPQRESCNGIDEDCDGRVDEGSELPCADGNEGCARMSDGTFSCTGACRAGVRRCRDGVLDTMCSGQVLPTDQELCGATPAMDDDCDGATDETCACTPGEMQECYNGPPPTRDVGTCRHGIQTCTEGAFGPCMNEIIPIQETCMNEGQDDDCNGVEDDVPARGRACRAAAQGTCGSGTMQCDSDELHCQPASPLRETCNMIDDDCDGTVDENLLQDDPNNCGQCGHRCDARQLCCAGQCVDTATDSRHCGACNNACPNSGSNCCSGQCTDLDGDRANCGTCGRTCPGDDLCCGGVCVSRIADDHCGSCTNVCSNLETCCPTGTCGILDALGICL